MARILAITMAVAIPLLTWLPHARDVVTILRAAARITVTLFLVIPAAHAFYFGGIPWERIIAGSLIGLGVVIVLLVLARIIG